MKIKIAAYNIVILVILLVVYLLIDSIPLLGDQDEVFEEITAMNNLQAKAVDIMVETNKLLISLSLLVIGVFGGLLIRKYEINYTNSQLLQALLIFGLMSSCISIYFGYRLYAELTYMMSYCIYDVDNDSIVDLRNSQFICFLGAIVLGVYFLINHSLLVQNEKK
ncbi:MAG: hypothetical protein AAF620_09885 [Bacteroidota bacterium]